MSHPLTDQRPMLAAPHKEVHPQVTDALALLLGTHSFEVKWDGVRCLAHVHDGAVRLTNRNLVNITDRYPEVALALLESFPTGTYTLDGEIVAFDANGLPSFDLLSRRDRLTNPGKIKQATRTLPVCFVIFDLLMDRGADLRDAPYEGRRLTLQAAKDELAGDHLRVGPSSVDGKTMWQFTEQRNMEGLIAKDRFSPYQQGRQKTWVKLKHSRTDSFVVTGYEPGKGKHDRLVGALYLAQYDADSTLVQRGKVGTGFSDALRRDLLAKFDSDRKPLGEPFVVEVEYASITTDGVLRFPSFKGIRSDVSHRDCKIDQGG